MAYCVLLLHLISVIKLQMLLNIKIISGRMAEKIASNKRMVANQHTDIVKCCSASILSEKITNAAKH